MAIDNMTSFMLYILVRQGNFIAYDVLLMQVPMY